MMICMFQSGSGFFQIRCRARKRWLVLAAVLSLTLVGAANGAQSSSGDSGIPAVPEPSSAPVTTPEARAPSPPSDGTSLTGTILATKPANARVIITDIRGRQRVYARGDETPDGAVVVEIHRDHVVLWRGGRLETLEFMWNAATRMFERAIPLAQATPPEDYRKVLRHAMFTHPELLLQMVGATVVVEGGHFRGYRVMQPEDPTFLDSLGLKPGDILTGVNGVPLDTPDYGTHVLDAMSGTGKMIFTVQRGNQTLVVSD
jgi:general secretion pathway protein C